MNPILNLIYQFWNASILRTGVELKLFAYLDKYPRSSVETLAEVLEADIDFLASFLDASVALELLEKKDNLYQNSEQASISLVPDKADYIGDLALHITNHWRSWERLGELVKRGKTESPVDNQFISEQRYWRDYMFAQHNRAESGQAQNLINAVDLSQCKKLLDLGGGMGSYAIALCEANPKLKGDVVDQKEPLLLAKDLIKKHQMEERVTTIEGDFYRLDLENNYDVVLISGVVCISSANDCRHIFNKARQLLVNGGIVIVQDFMRISGTEKRQKFDAMMDFHLKLAFSPQAGNFEGDVVQSWLEDVGFSKSQQINLPTQLNLIVAEKLN